MQKLINDLVEALISKTSSRSGGIGRHAVLRGQWSYDRVGSNPTFGIINWHFICKAVFGII